MAVKILKVTNWSKTTGLRLRCQSEHSAQEYYEDVVLPALGKYDEVIIDITESDAIPLFIGYIVHHAARWEYRVKYIFDYDQFRV